ncbi:MAG TPA: NnrU family protein [Burkholderiales bacterium]|jgi:uncharacterized membrane protein|nr:NnrU family protein [Burkholderiales bacterium]
MDPLALLALATTTFLATHFVSSTPLRAALIARLGEWPYRGLYSTLAFVTLAWMIWAYTSAPREGLLWTPLRLAPLLAMPFAFVLLACGYRRNPTMVGADRLLAADDPARGMIRITRHPVMWAIILWSAAHLLARGDVKSLVFFGGFLALAVFGSISLDRRKARTAGADWKRFAAATSHVPFVAVAQGRNRIAWGEIGWLRPLAGLLLFAAFFLLHPWLFGARPY